VESKVVVLGSGVIGLTTAVYFLELGVKVEMVFAESWENSTSSQAGALWHPFLVKPSEKIRTWSMRSLINFQNLIKKNEGGVVSRNLTEYFPQDIEGIWWSKDMKNIEKLEKKSLPKEWQKSALKMTVPLIEPSLYMPYLLDRYRGQGGKVTQQRLSSFDDVTNDGSICINCTGIGAKTLCNDLELFPIAGQTLLLSKNSESEECFIDDSFASEGYPTYIFPRSKDILIGGLALYNQSFLLPTEEASKDILRRCNGISSSILIDSKYKAQGGDRPGRSTVRLEIDQRNKNLIHNYGHSGSGYTLSWGCAEEAYKLYQKAIS